MTHLKEVAEKNQEPIEKKLKPKSRDTVISAIQYGQARKIDDKNTLNQLIADGKRRLSAKSHSLVQLKDGGFVPKGPLLQTAKTLKESGKKNLFFNTRLGGPKNNNPLKRTNSAVGQRAKSPSNNEEDGKYDFYMYRLQEKSKVERANNFNNFSNVRRIVDQPITDGLNIPPEARKRMELRMHTRDQLKQ